MAVTIGSSSSHILGSDISTEDGDALINGAAQNKSAPKDQLHKLSVARWKRLMYFRETFTEHTGPPPGLDDDITRAFVPEAWAAIDRRIAKISQCTKLLCGVRLLEAKPNLLLRIVVATVFSPEGRDSYEECIVKVKEMMGLRGRMETHKMDLSFMDRQIAHCFLHLKHFLPLPLVSAEGGQRAQSLNTKSAEVIVKSNRPGSPAVKIEYIKKERSAIKLEPDLTDRRSVLTTQPKAVVREVGATTAANNEPSPGQTRTLSDFTADPSACLTSTDPKSILHILNNVITAVKRGAPDADDASGETVESANLDTASIPKRKKPKLAKPQHKYKRCTKPFNHVILAISDGLLHLKPSDPVSSNLKLVFDVQSQCLIIKYKDESLSAIWPSLKISTKAIYRIVRGTLTHPRDIYMQIQFWGSDGRGRELDIQINTKESCKDLIQKLQSMSGCLEVTGHYSNGNDKVFKTCSAASYSETLRIKKLPIGRIEITAAGLDMLWDFGKEHPNDEAG